MSYRNGRNDNDVGWGCMIKVVQMLLAEVFMRYYTDATSGDVIKLFSDEFEGPFSLSRICQLGGIGNLFCLR